MRTLVALMTVLALGQATFAQGALAGGDGEGDAARAAILRQQEAFRHDDAAAAYAEAAPAIRSIFSSAETFIGMVRQGYAPVYRNRRFEFAHPSLAPICRRSRPAARTDG